MLFFSDSSASFGNGTPQGCRPRFYGTVFAAKDGANLAVGALTGMTRTLETAAVLMEDVNLDCGAYVDFVGRVGRLSTDITAASQSSVFKSSYDNTTFGLSAEVGYHWKVNETFYVEPQAELTYGFVKGDDFTGSNGASISQDDFQSLVGRLGARFGASFADGAGTVYAHASVNHEFLGDADFTATSGASRDFSVDLSGIWVSYGVGAQFNTSKNINFYGVLERSSGSDYDEDYRYSVGMRDAF